MAPPKKKKADLKSSAKYYREHPEARKKKNATTHANNQKPERKRKMAEATKARNKAKKDGKNVNGKDAAHCSDGSIKFIDSSKNRGAKTTAGDRRARGKKKTKK